MRGVIFGKYYGPREGNLRNFVGPRMGKKFSPYDLAKKYCSDFSGVFRENHRNEEKKSVECTLTSLVRGASRFSTSAQQSDLLSSKYNLKNRVYHVMDGFKIFKYSIRPFGYLY